MLVTSRAGGLADSWPHPPRPCQRLVHVNVASLPLVGAHRGRIEDRTVAQIHVVAYVAELIIDSITWHLRKVY